MGIHEKGQQQTRLAEMFQSVPALKLSVPRFHTTTERVEAVWRYTWAPIAWKLTRLEGDGWWWRSHSAVHCCGSQACTQSASKHDKAFLL